MNELSFKSANRNLSLDQKAVGYFDFLIDGISLLKILGFHEHDLTSPFGNWNKDPQYDNLEEFELKVTPQLESGRIPIYVCGLCGDFGCGAITFRIVKTNKTIIWNEFTYENSYEQYPETERLREFSFKFNIDQYYTAFESLKVQIDSL